MSEIYGSSGLQVLSNILGSSRLILLIQFNITAVPNLPSQGSSTAVRLLTQDGESYGEREEQDSEQVQQVCHMVMSSCPIIGEHVVQVPHH